MSNDKAEATYHDPGGELPQRTPFETFAQHGQPPSVRNTGPATADGPGSFANTGYVGRPEVSPGTPPWDSRVHQDLGVQHGWPTPNQPRRKLSVGAWVGIVAAVLVAVCGLGTLISVAVSSGDHGTTGVVTSPDTTVPTTVSTTAPTPDPGSGSGKKATKAAPAPASMADGTFHVGEDIPAGTYRTRDAVETAGFCYWEKTRDPEGSDIISNGIPRGGRPQVELKSGQWFTTDGCGTWVRK